MGWVRVLGITSFSFLLVKESREKQYLGFYYKVNRREHVLDLIL